MPKVIIIGAGMGGLVLAQYLRAHQVDFEIFERDEDASARTQGWALTVHGAITTEIEKLAPTSAPPLKTISVSYETGKPDETVFYDPTTKAIERRVGGDDPKMPIVRANRSRFRKWLSSDITVRWNKRFVRHTVDPESGRVTAHFGDGTTATGDILVGADGANSHVRTGLLPDDPLNVLSLCGVIGELTVDAEQSAHLRSLSNSVYVAAHGHEFRLFVGMRDTAPGCASGEYYWMLMWIDPAIKEQGQDHWTFKASNEERLQYAKDLVHKAGMHPDLARIIDIQPVEGLVPPFLFRDRMPVELPHGPVTIIGDAAHAMSPLRGQGGNNAMHDSLSLGQYIAALPSTATKDDISNALRDFEKEMVPRATEWVKSSRFASETFSRPSEADLSRAAAGK